MREIIIENILQTEKWRRDINKIPIREIVFIDENAEPIKIAEEIYKEWEFTGLNNFDFITTGFYKQGFTASRNNRIWI